MTNSKRKGKVGELELSKKFREHGFLDAGRTAQFCGNTGEASDLRGIPKIHPECKRVEKLNIYDAISQAKHDAKNGNLPTIFHRKNNCNWLVTMEFEDWIKIYKEFLGNI